MKPQTTAAPAVCDGEVPPRRIPARPAALLAHLEAESERLARIARSFPLCLAPDHRSI